MDPVDRDNSLNDDVQQNIHGPYSSSNANWSPTTATIRSFCFSGTERLLMPVKFSGPNTIVLPVDVYKWFLSVAVL